MSIERLTGLEIGDDCSLPREMVSCPGCGRRYLNKKIKWVCKECEECSKCCTCCESNGKRVTILGSKPNLFSSATYNSVGSYKLLPTEPNPRSKNMKVSKQSLIDWATNLKTDNVDFEVDQNETTVRI